MADIIAQLSNDDVIHRYDSADGWVFTDMVQHLSDGVRIGTVRWFAVVGAGVDDVEMATGVTRATRNDAGLVTGIVRSPAPKPRETRTKL